MDCFANRGIFLRSNGSIHCGCDAGKNVALQFFDPVIDYASDVLMGQKYEAIRCSLKNNRPPFPDICPACLLFWPGNTFNAGFASDKTIETMHIEPSFACSIRCIGCPATEERKRILPKTGAGHLMLNINVLEKILSDLRMGEVDVKRFSIEGHGEPLMNTRTWDMIALIRRYYPDAFVAMITNAHATFKPDMLYSGLDEIMFSIDGISHETYSPYRKGGDFKKAFTFMKEFSSSAKKNDVRVNTIWKYVVFDHNDKHEHLLKAQELALQADVSEIFFLITCVGPVSKTILTPAHIPLLNNGVRIRIDTNVTPIDGIEHRIQCVCMNLKGDKRDDGDESAMYRMFARLFAEQPESAEKHYAFLKKVVEATASLPLSARGHMLILHDRLIEDGIIRLPDTAQPTPLFDENFYLSKYADVSEAVKTGMFKSGFDHYRMCGRNEGRIPCVSFETA